MLGDTFQNLSRTHLKSIFDFGGSWISGTFSYLCHFTRGSEPVKCTCLWCSFSANHKAVGRSLGVVWWRPILRWKVLESGFQKMCKWMGVWRQEKWIFVKLLHQPVVESLELGSGRQKFLSLPSACSCSETHISDLISSKRFKTVTNLHPSTFIFRLPHLFETVMISEVFVTFSPTDLHHIIYTFPRGT